MYRKNYRRGKMSNFNYEEEEELKYLNKTLNVIKAELYKEEEALEGKFGSVIASRKEMWQDSVHSSEDFDRIPEMNHYLSEVNRETRDYVSTKKRIDRYRKMLDSPYFGRFDFIEDGFDEVEKIYIGINNLIDNETDDIYVYDWRAPVSSIFYRSELGKASYKSPAGFIQGKINLKRQYKIKASKLKYFFDSSIRINDEILQEVLSRNSSSKMRSIVETIQKEQDIIIRDTENELLIVQGVAGSGKTSIALHRIAFLLYEGLNSRLNINNVIIVSPNLTFSKYISSVLPELGEENVEQITYDDIIVKYLDKSLKIESREEMLEGLVLCQKSKHFNVKAQALKFKGSQEFVIILDRLIQYIERSFIDFKDIYYDGEIIETRQALRSFFLNNKIGMPIAKRLKRMENMILNKIHPLRKKRLEKIEKFIAESDEHAFEKKAFSRLLAIKEAKVFMNYLHSFTEVDYMHLYKLLFQRKNLFLRLSKGLKLPECISDIIQETQRDLDKGYVSFEDAAPLLYIKLRLQGNEDFKDIKQVVIDEAQDYYPVQYQIFKLLFNGARYTILGDFNQTIEKHGDNMLYNYIEKILNKRKTVKLSMSKSYRASYEINNFTKKLLCSNEEVISFDRHEAEPLVLYKENSDIIENAIAEDISKYYNKGYESIAIICKTLKEAKHIEENLKSLVKVKVFNDEESKLKDCAVIIPSYMAKGLEFDVVLVYDGSAENYCTELDRRLLYIACTRALHQLSIYYTGKKNKFI
jgi:DNA helicase-2/ATP-dependent DNA helicase PcrA